MPPRGGPALPAGLALAWVVAWVVAWVAAWSLSAGAGEPDRVWELRPYRVHVLLASAEQTFWAPEETDELVRQLRLRAEVELGRRWELQVEWAPESLQRICTEHRQVAGCSQDPLFQQAAAGCDKIVILVIRTEDQRSVEAWEWDGASMRWQSSRRRPAARFAELQQAAFEAVFSVLAPQGVVKFASGQRVVVRERASLVPVRNPRRNTLEVGSLWAVCARGSRAGRHRTPGGLAGRRTGR